MEACELLALEDASSSGRVERENRLASALRWRLHPTQLFEHHFITLFNEQTEFARVPKKQILLNRRRLRSFHLRRMADDGHPCAIVQRVAIDGKGKCLFVPICHKSPQHPTRLNCTSQLQERVVPRRHDTTDPSCFPLISALNCATSGVV